MPGLEALLTDPLVQATLAGYLGYIGSPRYRGFGPALSTGGLTALDVFGQAEAQKEQRPVQQAELELRQSDVAAAKQKALAQKQALDWLDQDQTMDPQKRALLRVAIANGQIDPAMLGLTPYQKGELDIGQREADIAQQRATQQATYQKGELAAKQKEVGIEGQRAEAEIAKAGRSDYETMFDLATGQPVSVDKHKPIPPGLVPSTTWNKILSDRSAAKKHDEWQKAYQASLKYYQTAHPGGPFKIWAPSDEEADAYARRMADAHVGPLFDTDTESPESSPAAAPASAAASPISAHGGSGRTPTGKSLSGRPVYLGSDGKHHYNPE